jgi:dienelactone hydrolase
MTADSYDFALIAATGEIDNRGYLFASRITMLRVFVFSGLRRVLVCLATLTAFPVAAMAEASGPAKVSFPGHDGVTLQGWLYAATTPGKHPAVIAMHGCSGLTDKGGQPSARHDDWGKRLSALGYDVLFPDSFASRGLGPQCKVGDREVHPARERVEDADDALAWLGGLPTVDATKIALLGWSNGGSTVLYTVEPKHKPTSGPDFARAVAFYPGCRTPLETGKWTTRVPLLILMGLADDWTPEAPCGDLASAAKAAGEPVEIVTYPGAYHDFDHPDLAVKIVKGLAFTANGDGVAHTGTNPEARADAIKRVPAFLAQ